MNLLIHTGIKANLAQSFLTMAIGHQPIISWKRMGAYAAVPTDALVLKHQAISINDASEISIVFHKFHTETFYFWGILEK